ncbi:hypothetical protein ACEWY4_022778 [Coilia grayii]|uniref:E3 ubiquitin/ISG15 ligase TRIM25-like n=1 Tax=Coilia grayii TaxID=363190 RepID=A0ABD1J3S8_9TELE
MATVSVSQYEFSCSICLDLLKDPVTVPCGHSFCMNCITGCWDNEDQKGVYSCPQCRQTFTSRPALGRNTMMTEVVEKLKKTELQSEAPSYAGPSDVECDFCTGKKLQAIRSCLTCLVSYCEVHVQPHFDVPRFIKHKLVNATSQLQEKICSQHDRIFEVFCRTDQKLICMLCFIDDHNGHETVSAIAERTEKQKTLLQMKSHNNGQIQQKLNEVKEVKEELQSLQASTQKAVDETERIFTELISFMEQKRSEVTESIRAQERAEVSRAEGLLEQLEMEITKLKSRDAEMEQLLPIEDPIEFLQSFQSHLTSASEKPSEVTFEPEFSFAAVMKSVSPSLRSKTKEFHQEVLKVTGFMKGDLVKLKTPEKIAKTVHVRGCGYVGCGTIARSIDVTISGVGVVTDPSFPFKVNFPDHPDWKGFSSQLNLVL